MSRAYWASVDVKPISKQEQCQLDDDDNWQQQSLEEMQFNEDQEQWGPL